jgi:hypothetical protein
VVGGAVVLVVTGDVVGGGGGAVVGPGTPLAGASVDAVVVSVVSTLARRVVVVVDTSAAIEAVAVAGVVFDTVLSVRARPKRNAPTATVTTRAATRRVVIA